MQHIDFTKDASGLVTRTLAGYYAFLPHALPPRLEISWELAIQISDADRALSELAGVGRTLPNPRLLIRPFMRREAVLSSRIEGTQASLSELFFFQIRRMAAGPRGAGPPAFPLVSSGIRPEAPDVLEAGRRRKPRAPFARVIRQSPDVREVFNYVLALEYGLARVKELPLSLRLIREVHARLMEGVRGLHLTPGEFRTSQNWIGPAGCTLNEATFVPPPAPEMKQALDSFEKYLHAPRALPPLVNMALIHYQFEAIHPFLDGNGRVGRLLVMLLLCAGGLLPQPLLYLSAYFERNRTDYYRLLLEISRRGAWMEWLKFFLRGVTEQAKDAVLRSDKILLLWQQYRAKLQSARSSALLLRLVDELFSSPVITVPWAAKQLSVTPRSAQMSLLKLVKAGILREATGGKYRRIYVAQAIIDVLEAPEAPRLEPGV